MLIDEIDLNLHPPHSQALLNLLPQLGPECQFFYTTHSRAISTVVSPHQVYRIPRGPVMPVDVLFCEGATGSPDARVLRKLLGGTCSIEPSGSNRNGYPGSGVDRGHTRFGDRVSPRCRSGQRMATG